MLKTTTKPTTSTVKNNAKTPEVLKTPKVNAVNAKVDDKKNAKDNTVEVKKIKRNAVEVIAQLRTHKDKLLPMFLKGTGTDEKLVNKALEFASTAIKTFNAHKNSQLSLARELLLNNTKIYKTWLSNMGTKYKLELPETETHVAQSITLVDPDMLMILLYGEDLNLTSLGAMKIVHSKGIDPIADYDDDKVEVEEKEETISL